MTQQEWFGRLSTWVPDWMLSQSKHVEPILQAMAKVMADHEVERDALFSETFIGEADASWLDTHGQERSISRRNGEVDPNYSIRIRTQHLVSTCDRVSLKMIVDQLLGVSNTTIREDFKGGIFCGRNVYATRSDVLLICVLNAITIIIDKNHTSAFDSLVAAVDQAKAFGVVYRVVERAE